MELVRGKLERFGELQNMQQCAGHSYGFARFKTAEAAAAACKGWKEQAHGMPGVSVNLARRDKPISHMPRGKDPVKPQIHKRRRKRRKLGVGEPVASWAQ